jgi:Arc-like DNA binding domain
MQKRAKGQMVTFTLRIPESLRSQIEGAARKNGTSLNSEMERRLVASFEPAARRGDLTTLERWMKGTDKSIAFAIKLLQEQRAAEKERAKGKRRTKEPGGK